jgi:hypothetical protein
VILAAILDIRNQEKQKASFRAKGSVKTLREVPARPGASNEFLILMSSHKTRLSLFASAPAAIGYGAEATGLN